MKNFCTFVTILKRNAQRATLQRFHRPSPRFARCFGAVSTGKFTPLFVTLPHTVERLPQVRNFLDWVGKEEKERLPTPSRRKGKKEHPLPSAMDAL